MNKVSLKNDFTQTLPFISYLKRTDETPFGTILAKINADPEDIELVKQWELWENKIVRSHCLNETLKEIVQKCKALLENGFILIPGGTRENLFHQMLYLLTKKSDGTYDFYVIHVGEGLEHHHTLQIKENGRLVKTKKLLARCYTKIPEHELFYGKDNTDFFKHLLGFLCFEKNNFKPSYIYDGVLKRLAKYHNDASLIDRNGAEEALFVTPAENNSFPFKLISCFIRLKSVLTNQPKETWMALLERAKHVYLKGLLATEPLLQTTQFNDIKPLITANLYETLRKIACKMAEKGGPFCADLDWSQTLREGHKIAQIPIPPSTRLPLDPNFYGQDADNLNPKNDSIGSPGPSCSSPTCSSPSNVGKNFKDSTTLPPHDQIDQTLTHSSIHLTSLFLGPPSFQWGTYEIDNAIEYCLDRFEMCDDGVYEVDRFAFSLPLTQMDWTNPEYFKPLSTLLSKYLYSLKLDPTYRTVILGYHHFLTILTLYYALSATFVHTHNELCAEFFEKENLEKAKKLIQRIAPPNDLFNMFDYDLFLMITNPKEIERFSQIKKAYQNWIVEPGTPIRPLTEKRFSMAYIPPQRQISHEFIFYEALTDLLNERARAFFFVPKSDKNQEEHHLHFTDLIKDAFWVKVLPSFYQLRNCHEFVAALCSYRQVKTTTRGEPKIESINKCESYKPTILRMNVFSLNLGYLKDLDSSFSCKQTGFVYLRWFYGLDPTYTTPFPYPWDILHGALPECMGPQLQLAKAIMSSIFKKFSIFRAPNRNLPPTLDGVYVLDSTRKTRKIEQTFSEAIHTESQPLETPLKNEYLIHHPAALKDVASLISEPHLAIHHLLSWYRTHPHHLKHPQDRLFFLQQFFKMTPFDSQNVAQIGVAHSPERSAEAALLFSDGLALLAFHNQEKPDHALFLFSSYILTTLFSYYKQCPQTVVSALEKQKKQMEAQLLLLKTPPQNLTEKQWKEWKQLYHMHIAYHLCIVKGDDAHSLSFSEKLAHYFAMHCFEKPAPYRFLMEAINRSIYNSLSLNLATLNKEKLIDIVKTTLEMVCPDLAKEEKWDGYQVHIDQQGTMHGHGKKTWVNLYWKQGKMGVNGKIFNANSIQMTNIIGSLEFSKSLYPITTTGQEEYLTHPAGTFKKTGNQVFFQLNGQNNWHLFYPSYQLPRTILSPFRSGFHHFYNPNTKQWRFVEGEQYEHFNKKFIHREGRDTIYSNGLIYTPIQNKELERIETFDWMYQRKDTKTQETAIVVPRYGLAFKKENRRLRCISGKDGFFLVKNTLPNHVVCVQERAIALTDESGGRTLLLIPRFKIAPNQKGKFPFELPGENRSYSCFHVQTTQETTLLIPSNLEATLDLISYRLYERRFEEVHALIESISPAETFTDVSFNALKSSIDYVTIHTKTESDHILCLLKLTALYFRAKKKENPFYTFESLQELPSLKKHYGFYLRKKKGFFRKKWLSKTDEDLYDKLFQQNPLNELEKMQERAKKVLSFFEEMDKMIRGPVESLSSFNFFQSKLTGSIESQLSLPVCTVDFDCKTFFSVYAGIESGNWDLKTTQNRLDMKVAIDGLNDYIRLALLCVAAKQQGIKIPPLPPQPQRVSYYSSYYSLTESKRDELENALETFKTALKTSLKQVKKESFPTQNALMDKDITQIEQKAQWTGDRQAESELIDQCSYPFNRLSLSDRKVVQTQHASLPQRPTYQSMDPNASHEAYLKQKEKEFQKELFLGTKRYQEEQKQIEIGKIWGENPKVKTALEIGLTAAQKAKEEKKETLLQQVNDHLKIPQSGPLTQSHVGIIGKLHFPITINDLENIAQWTDKRDAAFQTACQACPNLKNPDFQKEVWRHLLAYEIEAVYELIYKQALTSYNKAQNSQNPLEKKLHYTELARVLTTNFKRLQVKGKISPLQMLIFIRKKGLIPREDQLHDVESLTEKACILQKIMGGGKTAMIAPPWAFQQAQSQGKMPALFAESSLYQSLVDNLKNTQYQAFGQHVFTICPKGSQLEQPEIEQILQDLEEGYANQRVLVMKAESLEMLDIVFQRLNVEPTSENQKVREALRKVINFFKEKVSVLADEVDLILRADFEVNLPTGVKDRLLPSRIKLTQTIFEYLILDKELGIKEGRQSLQTDETLKHIFGRLGQNLLHYSPLKLKNAPPDVQEAFCIYLTSDPEDPIPETLKTYVNRLRLSEQFREATELIALTRHLVSTILPAVFKQTAGLHYGRARDPRFPGKVVPFIGVDTPSTREFGGPYEWLCKQFLTALTKGIETEQIKRFIETFYERSESDVIYNKIEDGETKSAKDFKKLTGLHLQDPKKDGTILTDLLEKTETDARLALIIETQTATEQVGYYGQYYSASSQSLPNMVHSFLGMTGTPAGAPGWNRKVGKVLADLGAEGKIEAALLSREKRTDVYPIQQKSGCKIFMQDMLKQTNKCPEVFLDMGALFKHQSIEKSARDFLEYVQVNGNSIKKGVLFFHHKKNETTCDRVALGQFVDGKWEVKFLENTREEALRKMGFAPDDCVAFFDQRHTTGTDLPLPISAHAFVTTSESIERRTLLQTVMRLRNFCSTQTADFVLLDSFYDYLNPNKERVTVKRLIEHADIQQAEKDVQAHLRAYEQQIDQVFVETFRCHIRPKDPTPAVVVAYKPFVILKIQDSPYQQFFCENAMQDPVTHLKAYAANRLALFKENGSTLKEDLKENEKALARILENAEKDPGIFPQKVLTRREQSAQVEREMEVEQEKELSQEIQIQQIRATYEPDLGPKRTLKEWWEPQSPEKSVQTFILAIKNKWEHPSSLLSAPEILQKVRYERGFDTLFQNNILMTDAMQRTYENWLSIFHSTQKPAQSILIVKNEADYLFTIVSQHEAKFLKDTLETANLDEVWLVNAFGLSLLENRSTDLLLKKPAILQGLIECSLFVGRGSPVRSLDPQGIYLRSWLSQQSGIDENKKTYLLLRNANQSSEEQFTDLIEDIEESFEEDSNTLSPEEIKTLTDPNKIFFLEKHQMVHLKPEQVRYIKPGLIPELNTCELIQAIPPERVKYCKQRQYQYLRADQLLHLNSKQTISSLSSSIIAKLRIEDLAHPDHCYFVAHLSDKQINWMQNHSHLDPELWSRATPDVKQKLSPLLATEHIPTIEEDNVPFLPNSTLRHLKTVEQMRKIPVHKVVFHCQYAQFVLMTWMQKVAYLISRLLIIYLITQIPKLYIRASQTIGKLREARKICVH